MASEDSEDLHPALDDGELSPSRSALPTRLQRRRQVRACADHEWHSFHSLTVRLLLPLEEGRSFTEDINSVSPISESESMGELGHATRCRSASASPSMERCKFAEVLLDDKFRDYAKVIARDIARVYAGHEQVDQLRLEMAAVLRGYARKHPDLGYTQGMCFLAAVTCSKGRSIAVAEQLFEDYMASLKLLWSPDFPLIQEGIPLLPSLLDEADMQLSYHLFHTLGLNLTDVLPTAWLSTFGKWLPFEQLVEVVPFLAASGLPGFLAITIVILTSFRSDLLGHPNAEDVLIFIATLRKLPAPNNLMFLCRQILPAIRDQVPG